MALTAITSGAQTILTQYQRCDATTDAPAAVYHGTSGGCSSNPELPIVQGSNIASPSQLQASLYALTAITSGAQTILTQYQRCDATTDAPLHCGGLLRRDLADYVPAHAARPVPQRLQPGGYSRGRRVNKKRRLRTSLTCCRRQESLTPSRGKNLATVSNIQYSITGHEG
jgi:hypothetical protein